MLRELHIRNFALIDRIDIEFGPGLNLLTGETGAGKSILIDALGLALGARSSLEQIRAGVDRAVVEALFDLADAPESTRAKIDELGVGDADDNQLCISREVTAAGKSTCRVNGRLLPLSALREIVADLIDIHGQHEHQSLLSPDRHLVLLDNWLGDDAIGLRAAVAAQHSELLRLRRDLEALRNEARERARNLDLYSYQLHEIETAQLQEGEEEQLTTDRSRLGNAERLQTATDDAYGALTDAGLDGLNTALAAIERSASLDPDLEPVRAALTEAVSFAEDARKDLRRYRDRIEFNPQRLEEIEERLSQLQALKRKYGDSVAQILAYFDDLADKITAINDSDTREAEFAAQIIATEAKLAADCSVLSKLRRSGSRQFVENVLRHLADLGMGAAKFEIRIGETAPSARGADDVEFLISTNPGEPVRPLARVASGGELSRLMLAMKSVLAQAAFVPTLIFDEIDVGVGGRTAAVIADKLRSLALSAQVVCITHLPQIASRPASSHLSIEKHDKLGRTVVTVRPLSEEARIDEIVRMLGGEQDSETARRHAQEMLAVK